MLCGAMERAFFCSMPDSPGANFLSCWVPATGRVVAVGLDSWMHGSVHLVVLGLSMSRLGLQLSGNGAMV